MFCPSCQGEYRAGFTRCADCDVALVEALPDGEPAGEMSAATASDAAADQPAAAEDESGDPRSLRLRELGLVLLFVFVGTLVTALRRWSGLPAVHVTPSADKDPVLWSLSGIVDSASALCVLVYVLFNQGRRPRDLGLTAKASDLPLGLALAALGFLPPLVSDLATNGTPGTWLSSAFTVNSLSLIRLLSLLTFSVQFELILCAFVMIEVLEVSGSAILAMTASVGLQVFYSMHRSLGTALFQAVTALLYCLFYWRTRRATPLILGVFFYGLWFLLHETGGGR